MKTLWLKPKAGLLVRCPITGLHLPEEGAEKQATPFWRRRLKDGDVFETAKPSAPSKAAHKKEVQ